MQQPPLATVAAAPPERMGPWYWRLLVPYMRREWPAWGRLYSLLGGTNEARWRDAGVRVVRGKVHGYRMRFDCSNWSERLSWCLARYHDLPIQLLLQRVLRAGDCFVDVGANIGMLTAVGAFCVGPAGRVISCEPNPRLRARLETLVGDNGLRTVELVGKALGEGPGVVQLREYAGHSGWGTLASQGPEGAAMTATVDVEMTTGDALLRGVDAAQPIVIKIDVEGFEVPALRGLQDTLANRRPLVIVEIGEQHQERAGFSGSELRRMFSQHGYRGYVLDNRRERGLRRTTHLRTLADPEMHEVDALFVPPAGPLADRLADFLPR